MIILGTNSIKDTGFKIANSVRFNDGSSSYLQKSASGGNRKKFTFSTWLKRCALLGGSSGYNTFFSSDQASNNSFRVTFNDDSGTDDNKLMVYYYTGSHQLKFITNRDFRDVTAWMHIVIAVDTTQGTEGNRFKMYINGVQETSFSTASYPSHNLDTSVNQSGAPTRVGAGTSLYFDGYMAETVLIDGTQYAASDFGEFDEDSPTIWKPKDVSDLTFGTNGFHLNYETAAELGTDANGGTALSETNLTALNQSTDTCTNNFTIWNGLTPRRSDITLTEGNLNVTMGGTSRGIFATIGVSAGKWYYEAKWVSGNYFQTGVVATDIMNNNDDVYGGKTGAFMYKQDGNIRSGGNTLASAGSLSTGNIVGVALDMDNNFVYFSKNGTFQNSGDPTSGGSGTGGHDISAYSEYTFGCAPTEAVLAGNFGSPAFSISSGNSDGSGFGNFEYAVPSGYFALCSKNLAENG